MAPPNLRLVGTGLLVTFGGSFHYGYQLGYINPTEPVFRRFFNSSYHSHYGGYLNEIRFRMMWSNFVGFLILGGFFGVLLAPWLAARFGRKRSFYISSSWFLFSSLISVLAFYMNSFELLTAGRIMSGIGCGASTVLESLYLTEISPSQHRGLLGSMTGFMIQTGISMGAILGIPNFLGTDYGWPILLWIEMFPSALLLIFLTCTGESPNYLVAHGLENEAKKTVRLYHGELSEAKRIIDSIRNNHICAETGGFLRLFKGSLVWKGLILGMLANLAVAFSGITATSFFATHLLIAAGLTHNQAALANIGIAIGSCIGVVLSLFTVDNFGRRTLLLFSCGSLIMINLAMLVLIVLFEVFREAAMAYLLLTVSILLMIIFGMGLSPIPYFLTSELVPEDVKSAGQSVSIMVQFLAGYLSPVIFFPLEGLIGAYSFLLFVIPLSVITTYFYFFLPETRKTNRKDVFLQLYGSGAFDYLAATNQNDESVML